MKLHARKHIQADGQSGQAAAEAQGPGGERRLGSSRRAAR